MPCAVSLRTSLAAVPLLVTLSCAGDDGGDDGAADTAGDTAASSGGMEEPGSPTTAGSGGPAGESTDGSTSEAAETSSGGADETSGSEDGGSTGGTGERLGEPVWVGVGAWGHRSSTADGTTWDTTANPVQGDDHTPDLLRGVAWGNGVFIAVGGDQNSMVMRSTDGVTWDEDLHPDGAGQWMGAVAYGGGRWVAVGGVGRAMVSDDEGLTWTDNEQTLPAAGRGVSYGNGQFVAVGDGGMIAVSDDALTWTDHTQPGSVGLGSAAYGHGLWVVTGRSYNGSGFDSNCFVSSDASTWSACDMTAPTEFASVVFADGRLVIIHGDGFDYTEDGATWTHDGTDLPQYALGVDGLWVGAQSERRYAGDAIASMVETKVSDRGFRSFTLGWVVG